jgi:predicted nucleotidyltransferase/DNA-binding XRE family transcriptional regulator
MMPDALIRDARLAAGLSQAELARRSGTSQPAIARYESGTSSPSVVTLDRVLRAAGRRLVLGTEPGASTSDASLPRIRALQAQRRALRALVRAHGGRNPRVFGSTARGEDQPDSDIDLVVDFDFDDRGIFPLFDLRDALSELLGERIDVVASSFLKPEVIEAVERDGIRI